MNDMKVSSHCLPHAQSAGMPTMVSGQKPAPPQTRAATPNTLFPPVLKDELPSGVILKYMDGISKKIQKMADP